MIFIMDDKAFLLRKFSPVEGRKLMMKGAGVRAIVDGSLADQLPILAFVSVRVGADSWIPLATETMVANHVPEGKVEELLYEVLEYNCFVIDNIIESPTIGDALWQALYDVVDEAIEKCC
jgi:hypothetical protein